MQRIWSRNKRGPTLKLWGTPDVASKELNLTPRKSTSNK